MLLNSSDFSLKTESVLGWVWDAEKGEHCGVNNVLAKNVGERFQQSYVQAIIHVL